MSRGPERLSWGEQLSYAFHGAAAGFFIAAVLNHFALFGGSWSINWFAALGAALAVVAGRVYRRWWW